MRRSGIAPLIVFSVLRTCTAGYEACLSACRSFDYSSVAIPAAAEFLPPEIEHRTPCTERRARDLLASVASHSSTGARWGAFNPGDTIGKYVHLTSSATFRAAWAGDLYSVQPPTDERVAKNKWARHMVPSCDPVGSAWGCLFGTFEPPSLPKDCSATAIANASEVLLAGAIAAAFVLENRVPSGRVKLRIDYNVGGKETAPRSS